MMVRTSNLRVLNEFGHQKFNSNELISDVWVLNEFGDKKNSIQTNEPALNPSVSRHTTSWFWSQKNVILSSDWPSSKFKYIPFFQVRALQKRTQIIIYFGKIICAVHKCLMRRGPFFGPDSRICSNNYIHMQKDCCPVLNRYWLHTT